MTERCPTCEQVIKPKPEPKRARPMANSALSTGRCPVCNRTVLVGWIDRLHRSLNPDPLTQLGELAMIANGLPTFDRTEDRARIRDAYNQKTFPTRTGTTVHTIHQCGHHIPESLILNPLTNTQLNTQQNNDNPPF
ncbi:hypothetical protein [Williamsia sp.]|uniref:hypothetical protein n=1 Tax=Williamsia sp. TaxID=1872085 RepID=UPI002F94B316